MVPPTAAPAWGGPLGYCVAALRSGQPLLETLGREVPSLQKQFHKIMSREIAKDHDVMLHLGSMHAEERVAAFLQIGRAHV